MCIIRGKYIALSEQLGGIITRQLFVMYEIVTGIVLTVEIHSNLIILNWQNIGQYLLTISVQLKQVTSIWLEELLNSEKARFNAVLVYGSLSVNSHSHRQWSYKSKLGFFPHLNQSEVWKLMSKEIIRAISDKSQARIWEKMLLSLEPSMF